MKGNIFLGTARGRMGDVVASIRHGKQIISKYQPNVLNPKSFKQMQQRDLFANATAFTKKFYSDRFMSSVYATPRGATKSLFLNINQAKIYSLRAVDGDLTNVNKIAIPMMQKVINGNDFSMSFALKADKRKIVALINGAEPTGSKIYFGSISELSGTRMISKGLGTGATGLISAMRLSALALGIAPTEGVRRYGFQNSAEDCGSWPYVYEVTMPVNETSVLVFDNDIIGFNSITNIHLFFFDNKQNAIGYANILNPKVLEDGETTGKVENEAL